MFLISLLLVVMDLYDIDAEGANILPNLPCTLQHNQLKCSGPGSDYPNTAISKYVDDNKALLRRMSGIQERKPKSVTKKTSVKVIRTFSPDKIIFRSLTEDRAAAFSRIRRDVLEGTLEEMFEGNLTTSEMVRRQASGFPGNSERNTDRSKEDICQSRLEVTTPFWAQNSDGQLRAILNNNEFEQAVHQEICTTSTTFRCSRDCSCEQKYKWHRLLAYDPNNDCAGIFMDWFLFPACCSCRCRKNPFHGK